MKNIQNTAEILQVLDKSNCKECGFPACLAFALAVFKGEKLLGDCPRIAPEIALQYGTNPSPQTNSAQYAENILAELCLQIQNTDLAQAASRTRGSFDQGKLSIKVLGKSVHVDKEGGLSSSIHTNPWVAGPLLNYILKSRGVPPAGRWVTLRELENGREWDSFFAQCCEKPMKKIADGYPDLFKDMIEIFSGTAMGTPYDSDVSVVLQPLPLVPFLICYWSPEDGMPSTLNIFFDANTDKNLPVESIYTLGAGLTVMFKRLALRHG